MNLLTGIENYLEWMISKGYAETTIHAYDNALKCFLKFIESNRIPWKESLEFSVLKAYQQSESPWARIAAIKGLARYLYMRGIVASPIEEPLPILPLLYEDYLLYFKNTRGVQDSYLKDTRRLLSAFCRYLKKRAVDLSHIEIEQVDDFLARHNSRYVLSTQRRNRSHLRNFFKYLYYERRIIKRDISNLIIGATVFGQSKPPKFLRPHEIEQVFEGLSTDGKKALRQAAMVHLGFTLGLRPKEISLLLLDDISFTRGTVDLPNRKCGNSIELPLPEPTIKVIAAYLIGARPESEHRHLFLSLIAPNGPLTANTVSSEITMTLKRVNPRASAYWLRHTYAQNMLLSGVSLFEVKEMLGHGCIQSTRRYLHIDLKSMRSLFDE